jgi:hypothetical protein
MDENKLVEALQAIVTQLSDNSNLHFLQAVIFKDQGFDKLSEKYQGHANEERDFVGQFAARILDLGHEVKLEDTKAMPLYKDPVDFVKYDLQLSKEGLADLTKLVTASIEDHVTYDLLKDYYKDEEEDLLWSEKELDLIEKIGKQNWLLKQI